VKVGFWNLSQYPGLIGQFPFKINFQKKLNIKKVQNSLPNLLTGNQIQKPCNENISGSTYLKKIIKEVENENKN